MVIQGMPEVEGALHRVEQRGLTGRMALGAGQAARAAHRPLPSITQATWAGMGPPTRSAAATVG